MSHFNLLLMRVPRNLKESVRVMGWPDMVSWVLDDILEVLKSMAISMVLRVLSRRLFMEHHLTALSTSLRYVSSLLFLMSPMMVVSSAYLNIFTELSREVS